MAINENVGSEKQHYVFKMIVIGESDVGKTEIINRYMGKNKVQKDNTIGVHYYNRAEVIGNNEVELQIWDTAGQERFRAITNAHYRRTKGGIVVFDLTNVQSFELVPKWMEEIKYYADEDVQLILIGNKLDEAKLRKISRLEALNLAQEYNCEYYETCAKMNCEKNVREVFHQLAQNMLEAQKRKPASLFVPKEEQRQALCNVCQTTKCKLCF